MDDEYDWRKHWAPRTKGGEPVLVVLRRGKIHVGLIETGEDTTLKGVWDQDGFWGGSAENDYTLVPIAPLPPRLTATELVLRGAVGRGDAKCMNQPVLGVLCIYGSVPYISAWRVEVETCEYCIPDPSKPASEQEWRPLSEVDLTR